ncbi:MAG: cytochrome b/b6 domain-containing protein [Betaproteobacteria bacterium]|nr:cytochrome b/b6 domain-containing protein [Betaproteobacteria bacterium]
MERSKILVWDLPTRIAHWLLAASFIGAFATGDSERLRDVHVVLGYTMLGLVAFRLVWGFAGSRYARFGSFAFGPRAVLEYLKSLFTRAPRHYVGHNPAGSWAIYALLALSVLAGATGYATYSNLGGDWMEELHGGLANALLAVVIIHVLGVIASSILHRENLVRAMLSGYKSGDPADGIRGRRLLAGTALALGVAAFWIIAPGSLLMPGGGADQAAGHHSAHQDDD